MRAFPFLLLVLLAGGCANQPKTASGDVPELIQQLESGDDSLRARAAEVLGDKGPEAKAALPALTLALRDEYELVREHAAETLGQIGPDAQAAVPALRLAAQDGVPQVREAALEALRRIDTRPAKGGP
jgi:HEAT repeat protein